MIYLQYAKQGSLEQLFNGEALFDHHFFHIPAKAANISLLCIICPAGYITGESLRNGTSLQYAKQGSLEPLFNGVKICNGMMWNRSYLTMVIYQAAISAIYPGLTSKKRKVIPKHVYIVKLGDKLNYNDDPSPNLRNIRDGRIIAHPYCCAARPQSS